MVAEVSHSIQSFLSTSLKMGQCSEQAQWKKIFFFQKNTNFVAWSTVSETNYNICFHTLSFPGLDKLSQD